MAAYIDREGTFEARVTQADVEKKASGAVMAEFTFEITREWNNKTKEYGDAWPAGWLCSGGVCFFKKNGEAMEDNILRVVTAMGWNGKVAEIGHTIDSLVRIKVKRDEYNGNVRFIADRIEPAQVSSAADLDNEFGAVLQAYAAQAGPITPARAPEAAPAEPPAAPPAAPPTPETAAAAPDDNVPF